MDGQLLQIAVSSLILCDSTHLRLLAQIDETGLILLISLIVHDMTGSSPDIRPQSEFPEACEEFKHAHSSCFRVGDRTISALRVEGIFLSAYRYAASSFFGTMR